MPKIPRYETDATLTKEAPSVPVNAEAYGTFGKGLQEMGQTLGVIGQTFEKLRDIQQVSEAETEAAQRMEDLRIRTDNDPDIYGAGQRAEEELRKIREDTSNKISSVPAKMKYGAEYDLKSVAFMHKVNTDLKGKQVDLAQATMLKANDVDKEAYFNAASAAEQQMIKDRMKNRVDEMMSVGAIDQMAGYKYWTATEHDLNVGQVKNDIELDAGLALRELQKGKEGIYPDITTEERQDLTKAAEYQIARSERIAKQNIMIARNKNEAAMVDKYWNGTLTNDEVENGLLTGGISAGFGNTMMKNLQSPKSIDAKTDPETYMKLVDSILTPGRNPFEVRAELLKANTDGKLSRNDLQRLYTTRMIPGSEGNFSLAEEVTGGKNEDNPIVKWLKAGVKVITDTLPPFAAFDAVKNLFSRTHDDKLDGPQIVGAANDEVKQHFLELNPNIATYPKEGKEMIDAYGNKALVFPNGSYKILGEEKKTEEPGSEEGGDE